MASLGANLQDHRRQLAALRRLVPAGRQRDLGEENLDKGDSIDVEYDGGPTAELTLDGSKPYEIRLACGD